MRVKILFHLFLLITSTFLYSDSNYWGITGLIRTPTARTIQDGNLRYTFAYGREYRTSALSFGFLPFLELGGMVVVPSAWETYGDKYPEDRSLNIKLRILGEKNYLPSLSVGVIDIDGDSRQFFTEYMAASKKIRDFDFTVGYGGRLFGDVFSKERPGYGPVKTRELDGLFGGIEWNIRDNISLLIEYDPTRKLLGSGKDRDINHHYNYGLRWNPFQWLTLGYSYQRGEEHNVQFALTYPLGGRNSTAAERKPLLDIFPDQTPVYDDTANKEQAHLPSFMFLFEPLNIEFYGRNHLYSDYDIQRFAESGDGPAVSLIKNFGAGFSAETHVKFPLYAATRVNDYTWGEYDPPLTESIVKTDIIDYMGRTGLIMETLNATKFLNIRNNQYLRVMGGYRGLDHAGVSAEYLRTFSDGRFALGQEIIWGKKRNPDLVFGLTGTPVLARSLNAYFFMPEVDTTVATNIGRFLTKEEGVRFQITRDIKYGKVFLWFARMESDNYFGNRVTHFNQGIGILVPVNVFGTFDHRGRKVSPPVSPGRREPGSHVYKYGLYDYIRDISPVCLFND